MVINPRPFCGLAEVPGVTIARIFKLATHILVLLLKLLVYTEQFAQWVGLVFPHYPHLRRAINSARSFLHCSIIERCL